MSVVGTLAVRIRGDSSHLDKTLKTSQSGVAAFAKASAVALTAAAGAFAVFTKKTIDSFDRLAKLSVQAGVTTESLSALGYAAELSGINTDTLATNLGRLSRGMIDAANGTGEAKKAFDALGIEGGSIKNADEALMQIADKFQQLPDGAQKTALAMQLFGRSGMQMIPFLNQGRDGLEEIRKEAERFGIVVSTDAAKAAEQFNDNLTRLGAIGRGVFNNMANEWLPTINDFVGGLIDAKTASLNLGEALFAALGMKKITGLTEASKVVIEQTVLVNKLREEYEKLAKFEDVDAFGITEAARSRLRIEEHKLRTYEAQAEALQKVNEVTLAPIEVFAPEIKNFSSVVATTMKREVNEYAEFINQITGRADRARLEQQQGWLETARFVGEISKEEYQAAMAQLVQVEEQMSQFSIQAARNIQNILGDGLYNALSGNFKSIGSAFQEMLKRMLADLAASNLAQVLFGSFGTTGQMGGLAGTIGKVVGAAFSGMSGVSTPSDFNAGGFSRGGYTGEGGQFEPAGIVHKGEFVLKKSATQRIGVNNLQRLNDGYANGGYVGNAASMAGGVNINIKNEAGADGYKATAQAKMNSDGGLNIDVLVRRVVASDIQNNGALSQQMANTFGLRRAI